MTICRYYLQGNCRFGDRCRFEHTYPDYADSEDSYSNRSFDHGYQDRYRQQVSFQSRQNRYQDNEVSFDSRRYNNNERQSSNRVQYEYNPRYGQSYQFDSYGNQRNFSNQRYGSDGHSNDYSSKQYRATSDSHSNNYNKNQYEWVSSDYKKRQSHLAEKNKVDTVSNKNYSKSTTSFSFKDTESDLNTDTEEDKSLYLAEKVKEDIIAWELGNQWPLTCYFPFLDKDGFPGFQDVSFEELRFSALKAEENNLFNTYVEEIQKAITFVNNRRNQLKQPTNQILSVIKRLKAGEHLSDELQGGFSFMNFSTGNSIPAQTQATSTIQKAAASFSFKQAVDSVNTPQNSQPISFSFKLPESAPTGSSFSAVKSTESDMYTSMDQLSEQDKQQFSASTFTLGKIPTVPPPKLFCF